MKWTKDFWMAAINRAIRTGAQAALSMITVGVGIFDVDWLAVLSVVAMSMVVSILTSIVAGIPETKIDGVISADQFDGVDGFKDGDIARFKLVGGGDVHGTD